MLLVCKTDLGPATLHDSQRRPFRHHLGKRGLAADATPKSRQAGGRSIRFCPSRAFDPREIDKHAFGVGVNPG